MNAKKNIYQMVTDRIIQQLEQGIVPWHQPWCSVDSADMAMNYVTRKPYSLLNQMLLGRAGEWLTFKQVQQLGGRVKQGAKSSWVVYYQPVSYDETVMNENGREETVTRTVPVLRYYHVFHLDDCEGIESKIQPAPPRNDLETIEAAEDVIRQYVSREGLTFCNDQPSSRAYYSPQEDKVCVPMLSQYDVAEEYYSTVFHEMVHSTMLPSRCNRRQEQRAAAYGSDEYSREELVAEIGSAMLCRHAALNSEKTFKNSVAYIKSWLNELRNDAKMVVFASCRAEKAAKYILQTEQTDEKDSKVKKC